MCFVGQAFDTRLEIEQGVNPCHGLQSDRGDVVGWFAFANVPGNVGQFEKRASGM